MNLHVHIMCVILPAACAVCVISMTRVIDVCCPCGDDVGEDDVFNGNELCGDVGDDYI